MPGIAPPIGGVRALADLYWTEYRTYQKRFREESTENILAYLEIRGLGEKVLSYNPFFSRSQARKMAARDTLKERLKNNLS